MTGDGPAAGSDSAPPADGHGHRREVTTPERLAARRLTFSPSPLAAAPPGQSHSFYGREQAPREQHSQLNDMIISHGSGLVE